MAIMARLSQKLQMWQFPVDGGEPYGVGELDPVPRDRLSRLGARPEREQYLANAGGSIPAAAGAFDEFGGCRHRPRMVEQRTNGLSVTAQVLTNSG